MRNPKSPMRLTMNAFFPAEAAESFVNQNPISRYDARPTPFPPNEHQQVVVGQYQRQHEKHEQIQVGKKAVITRVVPHVADGVDVDEEPDTGHHEHHDHGKPIEIKRKINQE